MEQTFAAIDLSGLGFSTPEIEHVDAARRAILASDEMTLDLGRLLDIAYRYHGSTGRMLTAHGLVAEYRSATRVYA